MPIYQYDCNECDHTFDKIQKFSDEPLTQCPKCEFFTLTKVLGQSTSFRIGGKGVHKPTAHWGDMQ